ncbi:MAG: MFS transporter [Gammaproteobacteria bacterium]|nr:MFS transporter [Gammaproteobacteria bacterium]
MAEVAERRPTDVSLVGNVYLRFTVIGFMYFSQGLPLGLFGVAFPTHLAEIGFTKSEIATFLAIIGLPWAFKFLAGPLMDRVSFLIYGHRRPWVVIAQIGLMITFATSAVVASVGEPDLLVLAGCGFVLNVFASTQDVAVDGLAIGVLKEGERSKATALMFGSQSIGRFAGMVGGGFLLGAFGISAACVAASLTVFLLLLLPVMLKERSIEKRFPWSEEGQIAPEILALKVDAFFLMLFDILKKLAAPISLFFIVAFFCDSVAGGLLGAYLPSFSVIDLGWDDGAYNAWFGTIGLITAGTGLLLSPVFDYYGQRNCMIVLCAITAAGIVAFVSVPFLQEGLGWHIFMLGFWLSQHLFAVLIISSCMELVTPKIAASQFAIYMSIANLSTTIGTSMIALVGDVWPFEVVLMLAAFFVLTAPVFFWFTKLGVRKPRNVSIESA